MPDVTSQYRTMLLNQYHTGVKIVMDEIEDEVNRLVEYSNSIDENDPEQCMEGFETIVSGLKELARKVY